MRLEPYKCYLDLIFVECIHTEAVKHQFKQWHLCFILLKIHFARVAKILHDLQGTPSCKLHTRIHRESGEFLMEFFDLKGIVS